MMLIVANSVENIQSTLVSIHDIKAEDHFNTLLLIIVCCLHVLKLLLSVMLQRTVDGRLHGAISHNMGSLNTMVTK